MNISRCFLMMSIGITPEQLVEPLLSLTQSDLGQKNPDLMMDTRASEASPTELREQPHPVSLTLFLLLSKGVPTLPRQQNSLRSGTVNREVSN